MTPPPRWIFILLTVGGLVASGIFVGIMRVEGATTGNVVRVIGYGVFGLVMLWGAVKQK
jgi:hypothetical protein